MSIKSFAEIEVNENKPKIIKYEYYQEYEVKLINGDVYVVSEPYDLKGDNTLLSFFAKAPENKVFELDNMLTVVYFRKKHIVSITATRVRKEPVYK